MNKLKVICFFMLAAGHLVSNNIFANNLEVEKLDIHIATGTFVYQNSIEQHMLLTKTGNQPWSFNNNIYPDTNGEYLYNTACIKNKTCIITAAYENTPFYWPTSQRRPSFLLKTTDGSWKVIKNISNLPSMFDGITPYLSCSHNFCSTAGFFQDNHGKTHLLLLTSQDQGQTWSYQRNIANLPINLRTSWLSAINCVGEICLAAGGYSLNQDPDSELPLILKSTDGGVSWMYVEKITGLTKKRVLSLNSISCHDNACVIVGTDDFRNPIMLASNDSGEKWYFSKVPELSNVEFLFLNNVVNQNGTFIAIGSFSKKDSGFSRSLILVSRDNGKSWKLIKEIAGSANNEVGSLNAISCNSSICLAAGDFHYGSANATLTLLVTHDDGQSWSLIPAVINSHIPSLNVVSCSETYCFAAGSFLDDFDYSHPEILTSDGKAKNWSLVQEDEIQNFPQYIYKILFSSALSLKLQNKQN